MDVAQLGLASAFLMAGMKRRLALVLKSGTSERASAPATAEGR
jgi:hypothetical protein